MVKLEVDDERYFKWLEDKIACPDPKLQEKKYSFYRCLSINDILYELGTAILLQVDGKVYFGSICYFYEDNDCLHSANRYMVAVDLFYRPADVQHQLEKPVELHEDFEVLQKDKVLVVHFPVTAIKNRCTLVYGLEDEEPYDLLNEFINTSIDLIYICRFIASFKNNKCILHGAVINNELKSLNVNAEKSADVSDNNVSLNSLNSPQYSVVNCLNNSRNESIKLKIVKNKKNKSPTTSMKNLKPNDNLKTDDKKMDLCKTKNENLQNSNHCSTWRSSDEENVINVNNITSSDKKLPRRSTRYSVKKQIEEQTPTRVSTRITRKTYSNFFNDPDISPSPKKQIRYKSQESIEETVEELSVLSKKITQKGSEEKLTPTPKKQSRYKTKKISKNESHDEIEDNIEEKIEKLSLKDKLPLKNKRISQINNVITTATPKKLKTVVTTPKSVRISLKNLTPSIQEREKPIVYCDSPMSRARLGLAANSLPRKVPCRENEYEDIYNFITVRIRDQTSGCMYISGVPGTGKTMTVCKVMGDMSQKKQFSNKFVFLKLNALALTEPRQIYVEIIKKLLNKKLHWEEALKEIVKFFKNKKKKIAHIILIDELDKLCNRKQDVVYNLLDLPFHSVTPLIVITIANTMDLPERILTNKVNSRLGLVRLTFKPYQYKDLVKIVTERIAQNKVFKTEALELVARKVAAVSGDARRALTLCARTTEVAELENQDLITMDIVDRVLKEMANSSKVQAIQSCSRLEQFILSAIASEVSRTGNEEVPFLNMFHNLEKLCILERLNIPCIEICLKCCHNLGSFRLLITQHGKMDIHMTLMLNISTDDIHYALQNNH